MQQVVISLIHTNMRYSRKYSCQPFQKRRISGMARYYLLSDQSGPVGARLESWIDSVKPIHCRAISYAQFTSQVPIKAIKCGIRLIGERVVAHLSARVFIAPRALITSNTVFKIYVLVFDTRSNNSLPQVLV